MSNTVLGAQVPEAFLRAVRVVVAGRGKNVSDFLREVVARELGFSSFAEAVHFANQKYGDKDGQPSTPITDLSEGALAPYPPHSRRVTILRDTPASPLMDLIEQSDLPDGSFSDTE
jgi:hypothetical protein